MASPQSRRSCPKARHASPRRPGRSLAILALAFAVAGCTASRGGPSEPAGPLPDSFSRSGERPLPDRWWRDFEDPALNRLVAKALDGNPSLRATWDRLRQARAVARREGAARLPNVDASGSAQRTERNTRLDTDQVGLNATASYEVDLWGRLQARTDAARLDAEASRADLSAAAISLSANVARTWYRLVEARARRDLIAAQLDTNEKVLLAVETRFRQGQATAADVLRQRQLVEQRKGDLAAVEGVIQTRRNALSVLLGKAPGQAEIPPRADLIALPALPETGVPARLVQRRPDVTQAFFQVRAADRRVAAAIAERYPRIDLTASFDTTAASLGGLFETWMAQLIGQVAQPVFDAGQRTAEVDRNRAVLSERLNQYEDALLTALEDVENALAEERARRREAASLQAQRDTAEAVVSRLRQRYARGATDFLDVLDSLTSEQDVAQRLLATRRDLILARIDLARALAGGWRLDAPAPRRLQAGEASS
jgi:NodT family efflux transporter outer membrane factor (OMF) lipoprotein